MRIIITYLTGIGNTILFMPTLRLLRTKFSDACITVIVRSQANKELIDSINCADETIVLNEKNPPGIFGKLKVLQQIRRQRYDISITPFPLNRIEFNILSFILRAKRRFACRYHAGFYQTFNFLHTNFIEASTDKHEIDHNLELLRLLAIQYTAEERKISLPLTDEQLISARQLLSARGTQKGQLLVGIHPGSITEAGDLLKRWPADKYARLADQLLLKYGAKILLFGVQAEQPLLEQINNAIDGRGIVLTDTSIMQTAAIISLLDLFIANDSGPMHIAVAMQTPTIAFFGPSDPRRNGHENQVHTIVRKELDCSPCKKYPHYQYNGSNYDCIFSDERYGQCLQMIQVKDVLEVIENKYGKIIKATN